MASKVFKSGGRWRFTFSSTKMEKKGYPKQRVFAFNTDHFKKSDVERIRDHYDDLFKTGQWNPWVDDITDLFESKSTEYILLSEAVRLYKLHIPKELAKNTVQTAGDNIKILLKSVGDIPCSELNAEQLTDLINSVENYHSRRTIHYHINRFLSWLHNSGYSSKKIQITMFATKAEKKKQSRTAITFSQFQDLLIAFDQIKADLLSNPHTPKSQIENVYQRHKDITTGMFYMGLRMSDVIHCRPAWIINDYRFLRIGDLHRWKLTDSYRPKSQKEFDGPIVIPSEVQQIFRRRMSGCNGMYDRLFDITYAKRYQEPLKKACKRAFDEDICAAFSPHALRHSCATYWLNERGISVQQVQQLMRHANISMTMKYYHASTSAHYAAFNGGEMKVLR